MRAYFFFYSTSLQPSFLHQITFFSPTTRLHISVICSPTVSCFLPLFPTFNLLRIPPLKFALPETKNGLLGTFLAYNSFNRPQPGKHVTRTRAMHHRRAVRLSPSTRIQKTTLRRRRLPTQRSFTARRAPRCRPREHWPPSTLCPPSPLRLLASARFCRLPPRV